MKRYLILLFLAFASHSFGQGHVLILKDGTEIRGKLVDMDSTGTRIKTRDGSIWSFAKEEIASIEEYFPKVSGKGVFMRAELGILGGNQVSPSVLITNGYSFNSHLDLGLAMGFEYFWSEGYIPFLLNFRYNLFNKPSTPFVGVLAGYEMPISNWEDTKGGISTGVKFGFTQLLGSRCAFSTSVGYRFAYLKEINSWWDDNFTFRQINRLEIKFGLTFK